MCGTYNICKFQAESQNTDAGQGVVDWGPRGLRKYGKTPHGHPSYVELGDIWLIHMQVNNFLYLQASSLNIKYGM